MSVLYRDNTEDMNDDNMSHINLRSTKSVGRKQRNNEDTNDDNADQDNIYS